MDRPINPERLLRVVAPNFVAGAVFKSRHCIRAAPKIKWMIGKTYSDIQFNLQDKNWKLEWII